jgi:hypothetical protein
MTVISFQFQDVCAENVKMKYLICYLLIPRIGLAVPTTKVQFVF